MPTIIDELVVILGLDPKGFKKGREEVQDGQKKIREDADKTRKTFEDSNKRSAQTFSTVRNELAGMFVLLSGGVGLTQFIKNMIVGDAATARLARNLSIGTQELSTWQLALKDVGGDAADANSAFQTLTDAYTDLILTGTTANQGVYQRLGITSNDLNDRVGALLKIADAGEGMDKTVYASLLGRLGFTPATISFLMQGRKAIEASLISKRAEAAASEENARQAEKMTKAWSDFSATVKGVVREPLYGLITDLTAATKALGGLLDQWKAFAGVRANDPLYGATGGRNAWDFVGEGIGGEFGGWISKNMGARGSRPAGGTPADPGARYNVHSATGRPVDQSQIPTPLGGGAAAGGGASGGNRGDQFARAYRYFKSQGVSDAATWGLLAGMYSEGGSRTARPIGKDGKPLSSAQGWFQWLRKRQKDYEAWSGKKFKDATDEDQWAFALHELRRGTETGAGSKILNAHSADEAFHSVVYDYLRPGKDAPKNIARGHQYLQRSGRLSALQARGEGTNVTIGQMTVNTQATDAEGIAAALPGAIKRRGLNVQASRGLD